MSEYTISVSVGHTARVHDLRTPESVRKGQARKRPIYTNIDADKTKDNVVLVSCTDTREKFNEIFSPAVEEYNARQKRKDRRITDYYQQCLDNKKMKDPIQEVVIAVGNKDEHPEGKEAVEILTDAFEQFKADNPNLPVMWAVIHVDEATPHLHIAVASTSKGRKNGLSMKAGFDAAYREQGFKVTRSNPKPTKAQWQEKQMESLERVLVSHGHVRKEVDGEKRPHEPVDVFKENEKLRQENRQLKEDNARLQRQARQIKSLVDDMTSGDTFTYRGKEYPTRGALITQQREAVITLNNTRAELGETQTELNSTRAELQELTPKVKNSQEIVKKAREVEEKQVARDKAQDARDAEQSRREAQYQEYVSREVRWEREDYKSAAREYREKAERITGGSRFIHFVSEVLNVMYDMVPERFQTYLSRLDETEIVERVRGRTLSPSLSESQMRAATYVKSGAPKLWTKQTSTDSWDYEPDA